MCSYYNSCFLEKDCCYRNNCGIRLRDGDLEHCLIKKKNRCLYVLLSIYMFWHPSLALGILKMLIRVCFRYALQPTDCQFVPGMIWLSASFYNKCTLFTVNFCYFQVLAMHKKVLSQTKSIMDKSVFLYWWFYLDL